MSKCIGLKIGVLLLGALLPPAQAEQRPSPGQTPIRPLSECLDPKAAQAFLLIDNNRLLIDAGRQHFLIELRWSCPWLYHASALDFRSRNSAGRICGDVDEQVGAAHNPALQPDRCRVASVTPISRDEYLQTIARTGRGQAAH
ncbi:DUF6491 family protein [Pseudomarimonas arenosa]|uniref:Uncharacterized protein n=1 Tax=Pseudomarimonas arenosa TaxID=2774145 RepID=A0AAW3ZIW1_9GAMM|nr:DUF6491 family protein [Pseudomarimonas arenosa]MBD8524654.1 hypothetical protein [Pseudomarimonas arenosa]